MTKLSSFVRLDFMTIKPYFKSASLMIYGVIALLLTSMSGSVSSGMGVGVMLATLFISYPFVVGERHNMDALYITLSLGRNEVVTGRYLFTLLMNVCLVLAAFVLSFVGIFVMGGLGLFDTASAAGSNDGDGFLVLAVVLIVVQAVQLPIYFRLGYTRAKFVSIIPLAIIIGGYFALTGIAGDTFEITASGFEYLAVGVVISAIVFVSYRLSVAFYKRREF